MGLSVVSKVLRLVRTSESDQALSSWRNRLTTVDAAHFRVSGSVKAQEMLSVDK